MKTRGLIITGLIGVSLVVAIFLMNNQNSIPQNEGEKKLSRKARSIKGAIEYLHSVRADLETGEIDMAYVYEVKEKLKQRQSYRNIDTITWKSHGPDNVGGRIRAFVIDKDNPNILYAGSVSGGFYKSTNGGQSWINKLYEAEMGGLVISCLAQAQDSEGTLYFGTGERFFTYMSGTGGDLTSGSYGGGIYKSTDHGETWTFLSTTDPNVTGQTMFENIQDIIVDPSDANIVFAATYNGLMKSTDKGATWNRATLPSPYTTRVVTELEYGSDGTLYGSVWIEGSTSTIIFRSTDGSTFEDISDNFPSDLEIRRATIAVSPSNPKVIYVATADGNYAFEGLYKSTDGGDSWTSMVPSGSQAEVFGGSGHYQGQYDNCIAVDPYDEDRVFVGGVDFYCLDGTFWYKAASSVEWNDNDETDKNEYYVHSDNHLIKFDTKSTPNRMYITSDGGIYASTDFSNKYPTYTALNFNLTSTQFYAIDVSTRGDIVGGTQDNGSLRIEYAGLTGKSSREVLSGDGFYTAISKIDPNIYFYESQYGNIKRSNNRGADGESFGTDIGISEVSSNFNTPFRLWEDQIDSYYYDTLGIQHDTVINVSKFFVAVYGASSTRGGIWLSPHAIDFNADTVKWFLVSDGLGGFVPHCIEYTSDGNTVFVGGYYGGNGRLYRISGLNKVNFSAENPDNFDPTAKGIKTELLETYSSRTVTGIGISPVNDNVVGITLGNYVSSTYEHIFLSTNALDSTPDFTSIQGDLEGFPVYDIAFNQDIPSNDPDTILIATEFGMWSTFDGGNSWDEINKGISRGPIFMIRQLKYKAWQNGYTFFIATHGQGIYSTTSLTTSIPETSDKQDFESYLSIYPNPVIDYTNLLFNVKYQTDLKAQIIDLQGKIVKSIDLNQVQAGKNTVQLNTADLRKGTYLVLLKGQNIQLVNKFVKIN